MSKQVFDLNGAWKLRELDVESGETPSAVMDVQVPNSVYCNLAEAGRFEISDIENNPENYAWIADAHWIYSKTFDCPAEVLKTERVELVFEGLDTVARILLNGEEIGQTENMYLEHRFDAKALLKPEGNELVVAFEPVGEYGERMRDEHLNEDIKTRRSYIRKGQYVYGWDWCPPLQGCGIWRAVSLEGVSTARIENVYVQTLELGDNWADLKLEVELDRVADADLICEYSLTQSHEATKSDAGLGGLVASCENNAVSSQLKFSSGQCKAETIVRIENPELWWPIGYGEANLQTLNVSLTQDGNVLDAATERFGIRTVELDTSPDEHGHKYQLIVNGQPVYIKGANWVPATMFPGSLKADDYRALIEAAVDVNMNILRVWGGGYYEDKAFYDTCDELGVMVWQEFMFACAYYPDEAWYHDRVRIEAEHVIKQLRNHPCKMIWCGNNECDWIHDEWWSKDTPTFHGEKIYHELLPSQMDRYEPNALYVPSSPMATRDGVSPNEPHSGDAHDWDVWNFQHPMNTYLVPPEKINRLATEFGMHAAPDLESVKQFCPADQRRVGSKALDKHNYQEDNTRIYRYIGELFAMPRDLDEFSYLSQLTQARGIGMYCQYLRAHNYRNHGIMIWQYNDATPCISWSMLDYYNRPKALMHYARRFFADVIVTAVPETGKDFNPDFIGSPRDPLTLKKIVVVNDTGNAIDAELVCSLMALDGSVIDESSSAVTIPAHGRFELNELAENFQRPEAADQCVLIMKLVVEGDAIAENTFLYVPDKHIVWPEPQFETELLGEPGSQFLKLSSDVFAKDLQISAGPDIQPADSYFDLLPGVEYIVALKGDAAIELDQIKLRSVQTSW